MRFAPPSLPVSPSQSTVPPIASTAAPATVSAVSGRSGVADSRMAATGGIRDARIAGSSAAIRVMPTPTAKAAMIAAAGTARLASSSAPPLSRPPRRLPSSAPTPMPSNSPMVEAISPTATASSSTEPITWPRLAPMARNRASSRVRCATMIENVFRIRNVPTNRATPAKPNRM